MLSIFCVQTRDLSLLNMDLFFLKLAFERSLGFRSTLKTLIVAYANNTYNLQIAADPSGSSRVEERPQQHSSRRRMNPPQARAAVRAPRRARAPHLGRAHAARHGAMHFNFPSGMDVELVIFLVNSV